VDEQTNTAGGTRVAGSCASSSPSWSYRAAKRATDVAVSAAALVVLAPLLGAVAVAVKLSSPGPVLFRQVRVGRNGRPFRIMKFRSMAVGAPGPSVTASGDARVTRVGAILRRTKLDEFPQLCNVFIGDMSLVGPRPEVPRFVEQFRDEYEEILKIRPGITDYAALEYRDEEHVLASALDPEAAYVREVLPAKIDLYRRYLRDMSLVADLRLLVRTAKVLLDRTPASEPREPRT
jgi:lipopolysaccharide/colanic/teichoic acid biosynthesis glycosyltransferase